MTPLSQQEKVLLVTIPHTGTCAAAKALHPYFSDIQALPNKVDRPQLFHKRGVKQLAHCHFRHETRRLIKDKKWNRYTFLRDPMLTVISQFARKQFDMQRTRPERMIEAWRMFVRHYDHVEVIKLDKETLGVDEIPWISSTQDYTCHEAYKNGDYEYVKEKLQMAWYMVKCLEEDVKPILDKHGFGKLPWYE